MKGLSARAWDSEAPTRNVQIKLQLFKYYGALLLLSTAGPPLSGRQLGGTSDSEAPSADLDDDKWSYYCDPPLFRFL